MSRSKKRTQPLERSSTESPSLPTLHEVMESEPRAIPVMPEISLTEALTRLRILAGANWIQHSDRQAIMKVYHQTTLLQLDAARLQAKVIQADSEMGQRMTQLANLRTMYQRLEMSLTLANKRLAAHDLPSITPSTTADTNASVIGISNAAEAS